MAYIGREPLNGFFTKQIIAHDGSTTTFALTHGIASTTAIIVSVNAVVLQPDVGYTISGGGTNIIFTSAPNATTYIHYLGESVQQNILDLNGVEFILDLDADTTITADTDDEIDIKVGGTDITTIKSTGYHNLDSIKFVAGTGDDLQVYHDGTNSYIANAVGALRVATLTSGIAITLGHTTSEVSIADNLTVVGDLTVGGTTNFGDFNITNVGSIALDTITNDGTDITLDSSGDIILDAGGNDIFFKAGGTTIGEITNATSDLVIKSSVSDKDILIKGNDGGATITALTLDMSAAGAATFNSTVNSGAITSSGIVTGTGFTAGSAVLAEAELELLDGLTAGTAIASKVVTTDASIDTTGQRNLTISGELDAATLDISGAIDIAGASQFNSTITVGANDTGYDIIFYGDTASANVTWDTSVDDLIFNGGAGLIVPDGQLTLGSTAVTSTATELNKLDGVTSTTAELNILDGVTSTATELNKLDALSRGSILYGNASAVTTVLTKGTVNQVLTSDGTDIAWGDVTGRTGTVDWDTTPKTATFSAVSAEGYFCNTSGGAFTVNLPAGSAGAIVSLADYAATWQTNALTVSPNGSEKIGGIAASIALSTEGQSVTFVYVDSTQGWINTMDSTSNVRGNEFIIATGGTITTSGNDKIHTFTGPGTFTVCAIAACSAQNIMSHMVIAGGASGGADHGGGGGAGGYREVKNPVTPYTASPLDGYPSAPNRVTITAQAYPITVGGGGATQTNTRCTSPSQGNDGSVSTFSTITSAGGGGGASYAVSTGKNGGSAGGGGHNGGGCNNNPGGTGNTPPVSPAQGTNGGAGNPASGGGGGAAVAGSNQGATGGPGGAGTTSSINGTPTQRAGGGGGSGRGDAENKGQGSGGAGGGGQGAQSPPNGPAVAAAGTDNTGSGGGGGDGSTGSPPGPATGIGGGGGSGIVIIRYKFQ